MEGVEAISTANPGQDELYKDAVEQHGSSMERLVTAYEADPDKRLDLSQEIHLQLWRSFRLYNGRCSLRTWTYRVAHHVAATHVMRERRIYSALVSLEELDTVSAKEKPELVAERRLNFGRLSTLIQRLKPVDRQVILCWLESMDTASIAEITGLSSASVAMRVHRIKAILKRQFGQGV